MSRFNRFNPSIPVVACLLSLTAVLRLINVAGSPIRLDDEGTYVAQAFAMAAWGELAHYTYWYDHPPVGWLQLAAWMTLTGPGFGSNAVVAGRYLMVVVAVVGAGLLWLLARRIGLSRWSAAAAVTILAVSPLAISLSRSVYLDNLAIAWLLGGLVLVYSPRHRLSAMLAAAICFGISVLTKETMLLLMPMVAWLVWIKTAPATRRYALAVFGAVFCLVVGTYALMAVVRGELLPGPGHVSLWEGIKFQLWQREDSGSLGDPQSLKRHTIDEWLRLDPVLPLLAAPIGLAGLLVERLRPYAVGLLILAVTVVRPGYLPVPFVIVALPLTALLAAGIGEEAVVRMRRVTVRPTPPARRLRIASMLATAFAAALIASLWMPSYRSVMVTDHDEPMRQAQQWITSNVPKPDRLIVDDAFWVDLVREGRDRRNVVWSYKVDTDEQVKNLAPDGWADYEWVVSTPSMRANMPDQGVLNDAIAHSRPIASFGSEGSRVDVLRVENESSSPQAPPSTAPAVGVQVAARLDPASDPDALATLQSGTVDQRIVAALAVMVATQPVVLEDVSWVSQYEQVAGTPQRQFRMAGTPEQLRPLAAFLQRQQSPFRTESVEITNRGLTVRFPARSTDIGLADRRPPVAGGSATVRVADMRRAASTDHLEFVRIDGTLAGSLPSGAGRSSDYRSMPAGTYVMTTVSDRGGTPMMRQAFTLNPSGSYTLALFSAAETSEVAAQLVPDGAAEQPQPGPAVRLLHAAATAGPTKLALSSAATGTTVLADNASYGLVTGYAPRPAGVYDAVITAGDGREWHRRVELSGVGPATLTLTDGPDGPVLQQLRDIPDAEIGLNPPTLVLPALGPAAEKLSSKPVATEDVRQQAIPLALGLRTLAGAVMLAVRSKRRQREW